MTRYHIPLIVFLIVVASHAAYFWWSERDKSERFQ